MKAAAPPAAPQPPRQQQRQSSSNEFNSSLDYQGRHRLAFHLFRRGKCVASKEEGVRIAQEHARQVLEEVYRALEFHVPSPPDLFGVDLIDLPFPFWKRLLLRW